MVEGPVDQALEPIFSRTPGATPERSHDERVDVAALKTYRYLRVGMIAVVIALVASIGFEVAQAGCFLTSISSYYYSPVRPIFVSALIAISVSLIAIKGRTALEDGCLNLAGMLAPIVAFVPTTDSKACDVPATLDTTSITELPPGIVADAQNNLFALLVAAFCALGFALFTLRSDQHRTKLRIPGSDLRVRRILFGLTFVILVIAAVLVANDGILELHGTAANAMFAVLGFAALVNGIALLRKGGRRGLGWSYVVVAGLMLLSAIPLVPPIGEAWSHSVLVVELLEITWFAAFWALQTYERWGEVLPES